MLLGPPWLTSSDNADDPLQEPALPSHVRRRPTASSGAEEQARQRVVDDHDRRRSGGVVLVEIPAGMQQCADRAEVARADDVPPRSGETLPAGDEPFRPHQVGAVVHSRQHAVLRDRHRRDTGHGTHALLELARRDERTFVHGAGALGGHLKDEQPVGRDTEIDLGQVGKRLQEETGPHHQHERHRNLRGDQRGPSRCDPPASRRTPSDPDKLERMDCHAGAKPNTIAVAINVAATTKSSRPSMATATGGRDPSAAISRNSASRPSQATATPSAPPAPASSRLSVNS